MASISPNIKMLIGSKPGALEKDMKIETINQSYIRNIQNIPEHNYFLGIELDANDAKTLKKEGHRVVKINLLNGELIAITPNEFSKLTTRFNVTITGSQISIFISAIKVPKETGYILTIIQGGKKKAYRGIVCKDWENALEDFMKTLTPMKLSL